MPHKQTSAALDWDRLLADTARLLDFRVRPTPAASVAFSAAPSASKTSGDSGETAHSAVSPEYAHVCRLAYATTCAQQSTPTHQQTPQNISAGIRIAQTDSTAE